MMFAGYVIMFFSIAAILDGDISYGCSWMSYGIAAFMGSTVKTVDDNFDINRSGEL
jgi:hypothetical protein